MVERVRMMEDVSGIKHVLVYTIYRRRRKEKKKVFEVREKHKVIHTDTLKQRY